MFSSPLSDIFSYRFLPFFQRAFRYPNNNLVFTNFSYIIIIANCPSTQSTDLEVKKTSLNRLLDYLSSSWRQLKWGNKIFMKIKLPKHAWSNSSFPASEITTCFASHALLFPQLEGHQLVEQEKHGMELSVRKVNANRKLKSNLNHH